ncbi:M43 family zinc metalloprotease [Chryseobacterium fluminis]|uniref:M43 family zinc metalloprotease n=1 Tax=Chryseobacterium fluminis TaxID=2983606 RepID=UPI00225223C1|nr:M43 family zinc metalloprotease [Chryseobacterium sp. MMS21-Ot14]UZT98793.1 M43 family zinc metalloprotease [Chryseobacterium sp. MMS21-Ot14]
MTKSIFSKISLMLTVFAVIGTVNAQHKELRIKMQSTEANACPLGVERCATNEHEEALRAKFPGRLTTEQFESWLAPLIEKSKLNKSQNGNIITIPVVVHVIHSGQNIGVAPNIPDAQVISQITVMNNDFRKLANTPGFNSNLVGADTEIQFALAKVDPDGNPTNGIDRKNLCQDYWSLEHIDSIVKPQTIWDPTRYMNMWSIDFARSGLLGYAQFPDSGLPGLAATGGLADTDGVVAVYSTFGSMDYNDGTFLMQPGYDRGRTMTHEVGHFIGLKHIWGEDACGTDYCADTPTAHSANYICNTAKPSCDDPAVYEMVQNYMDYTHDTCMNIYTNDQKTRMRAVMDNSPRRMELKTSLADQAIPLFPNDAEIRYEGGCAAGVSNCGSGVLRIVLYNRGSSNLTSSVISYSFNGGPAQTYNWTGNLAQDKSDVILIPVDPTAPSSPVSASIVSVNGSADQRASNNVSSGNYIKPATPEYFDTTVVTFKLQRDRYGSETKWNLKNSAGQVIKSGSYSNTQTGQPDPSLITQTWTLPQDCYVFTISDDYGDGLSDGAYVDLSTSSGQVIFHATDNFTYYTTKAFTTQNNLGAGGDTRVQKVGIYPNPTGDIINITNISGKTNFEIHNMVGQIIKKGEIINKQVPVSELSTGAYIITINNDTISEDIKFIKK